MLAGQHEVFAAVGFGLAPGAQGGDLVRFQAEGRLQRRRLVGLVMTGQLPRPAVAVQPVPAGNRGMQVTALPGVEHVADGHEQARLVETQHAAGTALVPLGLGAAAQVLAQARQRPGAEQEHQVAAAVDALEQLVQPGRVAVFQAQQQRALAGQGGLRGLLQQFEQRRRIALPRVLGEQGIVVQPGGIDQYIDVGLQAAIAGALPQLAGPMAGVRRHRGSSALGERLASFLRL